MNDSLALKKARIISPKALIQNIHHEKNDLTHPNYSLFLDIDGTLADFTSDPSQTTLNQRNFNIIQKLVNNSIIISIVTGRPIDQAKTFFPNLALNIAGTHGLEMQLKNIDTHISMPHTHYNPEDLIQIKHEINQLCLSQPHIRIEHKPYSIVLHYREHPQYKNQALHFLEQVQAKNLNFKIIQGKYVFELIPTQANKGNAIHRIIQQCKLENSIALFIGDDFTDEAGFEVINQVGGISIKVGAGDTQARFRLENTMAVTDFLELFAQHIQQEKIKSSVKRLENTHV